MPLKDFDWQYSYRTSALREPGQPPVDILKEFYIPFLQRVTRYDRVAGYFRSSSLALASRGMSTFVSRQGKMRLIAGADMTPQDVQAVIDGQAAILEEHLKQNLEATQWPVEAKRGVELLSWMVRHGHLEIKIALRRHAETGQAILLNSGEDGYLHEKWALGYDEDGEVLHISGSLNESATALQRNAENIDVDGSWQGDKERVKIARAERDFAALWENKNSAFLVKSLPDAVREKLLTFSENITIPVEINGRSSIQKEQAVPELSDIEALQFTAIHYAPMMPNGEYTGMYTAPVKPWPHQEVVARRIIENYPASHLMCDEVGLGKTIEAGLAFRSLYLSKRVKRILIAAPASLTKQWQREMASKFFLPFDRVGASPSVFKESLFPIEGKQSTSSLYEPDLAIVSTGLMARKERRKLIDKASRFDIALVDEAHYARRSNSTKGTRGFPRYNQLYQTISEHLRGNCGSLLLATATPMQLDPVEVSDLIRMTHRVGAFQYDPSLMLAYYQLVSSISSGEQIKRDEWEFVRTVVRSIKHLDPTLWCYLNDVVVDPMSRTSIKFWLDQGVEPSPIDKPALARLLFAAAPLSRVMQRHTRDLLKIYRQKGKLNANLADRTILPIPKIVFTAQESRVDGLLGEYCEGLKEQLLANGLSEPGQTALGFYLSFLRLRFASSLSALKLTLQRRKEKVEATLIHHLKTQTNPDNLEELKELLIDGGDDDRDAIEVVLNNRVPDDLRWERDHLTGLLRELDDITEDSQKILTLLQVLKKRQEGNRVRQTVIFTRFLDTLNDIRTRLKARFPTLLVGTYSGAGGSYFDPKKNSTVNVERDAIKHRFVQGHIDVLLCTDAAAEGLNLQTADMLINFDLPWNPMKVEQRIGRIDRIGQKYNNIYVMNLCFADSAEQFVYERLLNRLTQANLVVGSQQFSMLPITTEEFQDLADGSMTQRQVEKIAEERAKQQQENNKLMEVPVQDMFDVYLRLAEDYWKRPMSVSLEDIWQVLSESQYLKELGCELSKCNRYITLKGIDTITDGTAITTNRGLFEEGLEGGGKRLHFATYGDPVFEQLLAFLVEQSDKTTAFRVMTSQQGNISTTAIAFCDASGRAVMLTSVKQALQQKALSPPPCDDKIKRLFAKLDGYGKDQIQKLNKIDRMEKNNQLQAQAQVLLNNQIVRSLMSSKLKTSKLEDNASILLKALEEQLRGRDTGIRISNVPRDMEQKLKAGLLIPHFPKQGNGTIDPPTLLERTALESLVRRIDATHKGKKLTASEVIKTIERSPEDIF